MLKRIEIKNFESHKHTVIEDLSEGLNLIKGESMAGKTSIVRALKLAAYNEFDPKSLRTGETKCEVIVTTDKGTVKVIRGPKINFWEVTPIGQVPQTFDKVGKNIIPEAAAIMGLNIVKLGDADIPVNIMDQLESHFMLASLAGQDATGSLRAQVIDEISGLSGIEGVIKAVSLDNHRFGREIKENELKMEEAQAQMHDEQSLVQEQSILESAETELTKHTECLQASTEAEVLLGNYNKIAIDAQTAEEALNVIPDVDTARACLDSADGFEDKAQEATGIHATVINTQQEIIAIEDKLVNIPDVDKAVEQIQESEQSIDIAKQMERMLAEYQQVVERIMELNAQAEALEQIGDPVELIEATRNTVQALEKANAMMSSITSLQGQISALEGRLKATEVALKKAEGERDAILAQIKVCPVTLSPISPDCLKKAKV
jgi:DNA repair exonuclease SbcCD ATPase subunit